MVGEANPMEKIQSLMELPDTIRFIRFLGDPAQPPLSSYGGNIPESLKTHAREMMKNMSGPQADEMFAQIEERVDALTATEIHGFVVDMGQERFVSMFENNAGVKAVIMGAVESHANATTVTDAFRISNIDLREVTFEGDSSVLQKPLGELEAGDISSFVDSLNNDDLTQFLHQLPVSHARTLIDGLGSNDGTKIADLEMPILGDGASQEQIQTAIDTAIALRTDHEDGFRGTFNLTGGVTREIYANIRSELGTTIETAVASERQKVENLDAITIYEQLKDNTDGQAIALLNEHLPRIQKELSKRENMTFLLDAMPDAFDQAAVDYARSMMDPDSFLGKILQMVIPIMDQIADRLGFDMNPAPAPAAPDPAAALTS